MQEASGSWNWWIVFFVTMIVLLSLSFAFADPPPPMQPDPISIDTASPSGPLGSGFSTASIYGEAIGGASGGVDVGGPGPILHVHSMSFGVSPLWIPGSGNNVDGISNNEIPAEQHVIYFSGDDQSVGLPGTHYDHQAVRMQAAGDRFVSNGPTSWGPAVVVVGGMGPATINGPVFPGPQNLLSANQTRYNEIPTISPMQFNAYVPPAGTTAMDDMDALEITPLDLDGSQTHDMPLYFTLDATSPDLNLVPGGGTGADILVSPPFAAPIGGVFTSYAPFAMLGLTPQDEIDALAVWDLANDMQAAPGIDYAIFSLAPGSPTLAQMGWSPADVLATGFMGNSLLYLPAGALGMLPSDNIDGLDVEPFAGPGSIEIWDEISEEFLLADFDEDGDVDSADLTRWQEGYSVGTVHIEGDADLDGDVDGRDFLIWQRQYGSTIGGITSAVVPEKNTLTLVFISVCMAVMLRVRQRVACGG